MSRAAPVQAADDERQPLLDREEKKHYNLVGLSQTTFWVLCLSMWTCSFLAAFDGTLVATLLGPISSSFLASNLASWLGTSYLLSVCCFTPIYGRLANIIGRQKSMIVSLVIFGVGNALCAAAPSMPTLIAARAIAGIGGGGLQTISSTISSDIVPLSHRGLFQGYANIIFGAGGALGPTLGGMINDTFGWRWAFWVQIPLFVICIYLAHRFIRYPAPTSVNPPTTYSGILKRLDLGGCFLLAGWIGCILIAISLVTNSTTGYPTWSSPLVIGLLVAGGALLVLFVVWEWRIVEFPVLPVELLNRRTPIAIALNNLTLAACYFSQLYTIPLFYTTVRLLSPSSAGRHLLPITFFSILASLGSGIYVRATGKYYWLTFAAGLCSISSAVLMATWDTETPEWRLWTDFPLSMIGGGAVLTLTITALIGDVGREGIAAATGLSYTARMSGQVLGVGIAGAITQAVLLRELSARITGPGASEVIAAIRESSDSVRQLAEPYKSAAVLSYQAALRAAIIFSAGAAILAVISALGMREINMKSPPAAKVADEEQVNGTTDQ